MFAIAPTIEQQLADCERDYLFRLRATERELITDSGYRLAHVAGDHWLAMDVHCPKCRGANVLEFNGHFVCASSMCCTGLEEFVHDAGGES